jgi:hypothetical protein
MKPRALLIEPPYGDPKMEPTGLLYLATYARLKGFDVDVMYESSQTRFSVADAAERPSLAAITRPPPTTDCSSVTARWTWQCVVRVS